MQCEFDAGPQGPHSIDFLEPLVASTQLVVCERMWNVNGQIVSLYYYQDGQYFNYAI